jgi:nitrogen fixation protein FixH
VAVATDDGLVDEDYYRKGLFYDKGLEGEKALGWDIGLSFVPGASLAVPAMVRVEISKSGYAVKDASVAVVLKRPASGRYDRSLKLSPSVQAYTGEVEVPLGGLWDIEVTAGKGGLTMVKTFRVRA